MLKINYQLALPIAKKDVMIKCESKSNSLRVRYMYFTPEGYRFRIKFNKWLNKNSMSTQEWYDKYYLNIVLPSQRPRCIYPGCNEICEFSKCSIGYTDFCCHSHCQSYNWIRNDGESREKSSKTHIEYFKDDDNRIKKGIDTINGILRKWRDGEDSSFKSKSGYVYTQKCINCDINNYVQYDSTYELAFITYMEMEDSITSYEREPVLGITYEYEGKVKHYLPDFILYYEGIEEGLLAEIKPKDFINDPINLLKKNVAEEYCKGKKLEYFVLTEVDIFDDKYRYEDFKEYNRYLSSLRNGFKSDNEKIIEMLNNI